MSLSIDLREDLDKKKSVLDNAVLLINRLYNLNITLKLLKSMLLTDIGICLCHVQDAGN